MKFLSKTTHDAFRGVRSIGQDFTLKSKCVFGAIDGQYCIDYLTKRVFYLSLDVKARPITINGN